MATATFTVTRNGETLAHGTASAVSLAFALTPRERAEVASGVEFLLGESAAVSVELLCGLSVERKGGR